MKIKTKKKMDILELAQAVRDGAVESGNFLNQENELINVDISGINLNPNGNNSGDYIVLFEDLFEVETLEELTEETPIPLQLFVVYTEEVSVGGVFPIGDSYNIRRETSFSVRELRDKHTTLIEVYSHNENGRLKQLIWSKENGFADGILEVEE